MTIQKAPANPTKAVSYIRVSTARQHASGLGEAAQRASVQTYAKAHGLSIIAEYLECETGTNKHRRIEIYRAIAAAKAAGAVLLIAKLDRLARNVVFIASLMESGVPFVAVDMPAVTNLTLHVVAAVAEEEARMISARTKAALAAAKARGVKIGTPANLTHAAQLAGATANRDEAVQRYALVTGYARMMRDAGETYAAIAGRLNGEGHATGTGKPFTPMAVWRMVRRARA